MIKQTECTKKSHVNRKQKVKNLAINLGILIFSLLIFLLFMEVILRVSEHLSKNSNCVYGNFLLIHQASGNPLLSYELIPNITSKYQCVTNIINPQGIRTNNLDEVYNYTSNKFRIITIGDSLTYGYNQEFNDTYSYILEQLLKADGYDAEVINMGVSGYNIEQEAEKISDVAMRFNPDLILLGYAHNDHIIDDRIRLMFLNRKVKCPLPFGIEIDCFLFERLKLLNNIRTFVFFKARLINLASKFQKQEQDIYKYYKIDEKREDYPRYLNSFRLLGKVNKEIPIVIGIFPLAYNLSNYGLKEDTQKIHYIALENGISTIAFYEYFKNYTEGEIADVNDFLHYSHQGYQITAKGFYDYIIRNRHNLGIDKHKSGLK